MTFYLIYFGLPVALYVVLCLLPPGRSGWIATCIAALGAIGLFVMFQSTGDAWGQMLASLFGLAVVMAVLPRLLRRHTGIYLHAAIVLALLAVVAGIFWKALAA